MNKFLFFLFISLSLPIISPAQNTNITVKEANKKGDEYYDKKNYTEAIKWYRIAADQGDADAQYNIGFMYDNGYGVKRDSETAVKWYQKAVKQGNPRGQFKLGCHYLWSSGVTKNPNEGVKLIRIAAEKGYAKAQSYFGDMYRIGSYVTKDLQEALKWYRKAADQGDAPAQYNIGVMYDKGHGVTQNYQEALKWYQKAAEQGDKRAMKKIGDHYEMGNGVTQNYQTAKEWYKKAFDNENIKKEIAQQLNNSNNNVKNGEATTRSEFESLTKPRPKVAPQVENTFVVIFSNENYKYEQSVPYAIRDGEEFKNCCEAILGIPPEHIYYNKDVTLNEMRMGLNWLEETMLAYNGKARAIVYYSGHGMPSEDGKQSLLLPIDGNSKIPFSGYSTEEIYKQLEKMPSAGTLVLLDACFSGARRDGQMLSASRGVAIKVNETRVSGNVVVFSAANRDETAYPLEKEKQGLFTYYLLKSLKEKNGTIPLGQLCDEVTQEVKKISIVENRKSQTPTVTASKKASDWRDWILISKIKDAYVPPEEIIKEYEKRLNKQDKELNSAWFVFGTRRELIEQNILNRGEVLQSYFNKDYFTKVDIRIDKEIKLYSKEARILTNHPADSYTLTQNTKKQYVLHITDPQRFWSTSKYLVIEVKNR